MNTARFALLPREGLFCKNGRGWYTSDVGRSHSHDWPPPSTVLGALRAAWGQTLLARRGPGAPLDWERETQGIAIRKLLTLWRPVGESSFGPESRLWPVPADVLWGKEKSQRLLPRPLSVDVGTLGSKDDELLEGLWVPSLPKAKPDVAPSFWTDEMMRRWLRGEAPGSPLAPEPVRRNDIHVTLNVKSQTAEPGMLYQSEVLETLGSESDAHPVGEWALGVECVVPDAAKAFPSGLLGLGGKRRLTSTEPVTPSLFAPPPDLPACSPGLRLILATPAYFKEGWLPDGLTRGETRDGQPAWVGTLPGVDGKVVLRAAMVPRPLELSTWDMVARAPRATRRLVPSGATYFFEKWDESGFTSLEKLWLAAWGASPEAGPHEGLGLVLPGHWNPREAHT
ncbi:type III-B CRISPR module-associated protein Cmr3 [Myxococcus sp. K15C18031901]|uniref:type III-B CRISPR module-associated protein Cmr3 n=1 Tax=Myxococcus dinghuensis TaxID=2906761 RepID=UPI0020A6EBD5|nr:type III-B CRISPR module-associated protein Cmr3 [Myxococcus dinghuensis]MCP3103972.1 type III-B CRISPR module-associated protein Cmr3 [Myxococcus dinghuensis]